MNDKSPVVLRLEPEVHKRLKTCAARTKIKKYSLAIMAIEAAVEAIERNDYRLVVPIEFEVARVPIPKEQAPASARSSYQLPAGPQHYALNESMPLKKKPFNSPP